jgi:RNA polymerase sigma factor (TIGR02999 family)
MEAASRMLPITKSAMPNYQNAFEPAFFSCGGGEVTSLLLAWRSGDSDALDELMAIVYRQLHRLAAGYMSRERPDHSLSSTALVHEAYLRMFSADVQLHDRAHFLAVAASTMRRILIDRAEPEADQARKRKPEVAVVNP